MIGEDGKDGFGAGRLPKALPDPAPRHPVCGHELAPELLHFHLPDGVRPCGWTICGVRPFGRTVQPALFDPSRAFGDVVVAGMVD